MEILSKHFFLLIILGIAIPLLLLELPTVTAPPRSPRVKCYMETLEK
jgi:hypothetical protein